METSNRPQIKICGLTRPLEAKAAADMGADAIGLVFFKKSPRNLDPDQAREITSVLPSRVAKVGVFVDEPYDRIMEVVNHVGLTAVQLHGKEDSSLVKQLRETPITVIKVLYTQQTPHISEVSRYEASAFLVECKKGVLPGGNAMSWRWAEARDFGTTHPFILAGGLTPENVREAICDADPDVVDISSGVESSPGQKDISKVKLFIEQVIKYRREETPGGRMLRRIF